MLLRSAVVLLVTLSPIAACADWQYTKWGMTPEQTAQASKGQLRPCDASCKGYTSAGATAKLMGSYKTGDFSFVAYTIFDASNRLNKVLLDMKPSNGYALAAALRNKYGEPASRTRSSVMEINTWRDQKDQITLLIIGDGTSGLVNLTYQPRLTDANKGL
jgi:hypothetical protein